MVGIRSFVDLIIKYYDSLAAVETLHTVTRERVFHSAGKFPQNFTFGHGRRRRRQRGGTASRNLSLRPALDSGAKNNNLHSAPFHRLPTVCFLSGREEASEIAEICRQQ